MMAAVATGIRARFWIAGGLVIALAAAIVLPPLIGLSRFEHRISDSIGRAIGRPVRMSSARVQLLPRPGFEIAGFVVEEDPAFGVEPILRCEQVTAYVRLLPLWRGHLEIARISFDEPSVNLVRNGDGRWNFDSLLTQAAQTPTAPTGERHLRGVPRFPYISATDARVNFKYGYEKMPFSFLNADLAVWLENPGEWRVKLAAQPVRTDLSLDLANTGILRLEGSLRRAATIREMPVDLHAEWSSAPLGQLSRLFTGTDTGWRGDLDVAADITGNANQSNLKVLAQGRGIHRVEFEPREPMNLDATCKARFTRGVRALDDLTCLAPMGDGHLLLTGSIHGLTRETEPALSLEINRVPVASALDGVRLLRSGFAPDVEATGVIDGNFSYEKGSYEPSSVEGTKQPQSYLNGQATVLGATIAAPGFEKPLVLPALHFTTPGNAPAHSASRSGRARHDHPGPIEADTLLRLEPFVVSQPATAATIAGDALTVGGNFSGAGFSLHLGGESHMRRFVSMAREFGLMQSGNVSFAPQGIADVDLTIAGPWLTPVADLDHPAAARSLEGSIKLRNAEVSGDFLAQPLQIAAAQATFANDRVEWNASAMTYGPIHGDGTLSYPVFCATPPECDRHFTLHLATLDAATAQNALLGATRHGELLRELLDRIGPAGHAWPTLTGTAQIGTLTLQNLAIRSVSALLSLKKTGVEVESLTGQALGGALQLSGAMRMADGAPHYEIEAKLDHAEASAVAGLFQEDWGSGSINLTSKLKLSGYELKPLASSAMGSFHWNWTKGGVALDAVDHDSPGHDSANLAASLNRFDIWTADGMIAGNTITLEKSKLVKGSSAIELSGTIGFDRELSLVGSGASSSETITGTLRRVAAGPPGVAVAKAVKR
jgi:hypothetical protein